MRIDPRTLGLAALAALLLAPPSTRGSEGAGESPRLRVVLLKTFGGGPTREGATLGLELAPEWKSGHLFVGERSADGANLGHVGVSAPSGGSVGWGAHGAGGGGLDVPHVQERLARAVHVWWIRARLLEREEDAFQVEVEWRRRDVGAEGESPPATRRIRLREGERHLLDFLDLAAESGGSYRSAAVELRLEVAEDPGFAGRELEYELWMAHQGHPDAGPSPRLSLVGLQGEETRYRFPTLTLPLPGHRTRPEMVLDLELDGTIQGRIRPGGEAEVVLRVRRTLSLREPGDPQIGSGWDWGEKRFLVAPGETVRFDLPPPPGGGFPGRGDPPRGPRVSYRQALAGQSTHLLLRIDFEP